MIGPENYATVILDSNGFSRKENVQILEDTGGHLIRILNERSISDGGNLYPLLMMILK